MDQAAVIVGLGVAFNILISSGVLWKLVDFAREWGAVRETLKYHSEILRDHTERINRMDSRAMPPMPPAERVGRIEGASHGRCSMGSETT